jgi:nucleotide-binding universal stress UspA family protein
MWPSDRHRARSGRAALPERASPSRTPRSPRPILVGVDGSSASDRALAWATVRAVAGDTSLLIVHAARARLWLDPFGVVLYLDLPCEVADGILARAADRAHVQAPGLTIRTRLRDAEPSFALVDEGRTAQLIVLGRSHERQELGRVLPSVVRRVARRAQGRVVIVSPEDERLV